jgi:tetratricopeptide (TPR) repeat protein
VIAGAGWPADAPETVLVAPALEEGRVLGGGEAHLYRVGLRRGDVLVGEVVQRGIDAVVLVRDPARRVMLEIDSPNGTDGPEPLVFVARRDGPHHLDVRALSPDAPRGRYDLRIDAVRPARAQDRWAAEGLRLHGRALQLRDAALRDQGDGRAATSIARYREAGRVGRRALVLRERALGGDHADVASTHQVLGLVHDEVGDYPAGARSFEAALAILEARFGQGDAATLTTRSDLGFLRRANGDYAVAEALYRGALERLEPLHGLDSPRLVNALAGLGETLFRLGRLPEAEALLRRAIGIRVAEERPGEADWIRVILGRVLLGQGRTVQGSGECSAALASYQARPGPPRTAAASALLCRGEARLHAGQAIAARDDFAAALRLREAGYGGDHPALAEPLTALGRALVGLGARREAVTAIERARRIRAKRLRPGHPEYAETLHALADLRVAEGRGVDAEALYRRVLAIRERALPASHPDLVAARAALAQRPPTHPDPGSR